MSSSQWKVSKLLVQESPECSKLQIVIFVVKSFITESSREPGMFGYRGVIHKFYKIFNIFLQSEEVLEIHVLFFKLFIIIRSFSTKVTCAFLACPFLFIFTVFSFSFQTYFRYIQCFRGIPWWFRSFRNFNYTVRKTRLKSTLNSI